MPEPEPTSDSRMDRRAVRGALRHARVVRRRRVIALGAAALAVAILIAAGVWIAGTARERSATTSRALPVGVQAQPAAPTGTAAGSGAASGAKSATSDRVAQPGEPAPPVRGSSAVRVPAEDSPERAKLLAAAQLHLGTTSKLKVHQLYTDGAWAVGEIERGRGRRLFVAWRCEVPDGWIAYWSEDAGDAELDRLLSVDRRIACGVPARVAWP